MCTIIMSVFIFFFFGEMHLRIGWSNFNMWSYAGKWVNGEGFLAREWMLEKDGCFLLTGYQFSPIVASLYYNVFGNLLVYRLYFL
jgi:hypothetical protein